MTDTLETIAKKYDTNKTPHHLLPLEALEEVSKVLGFGAVKYGEHNWTKGLPHSRRYSAALRHIFAWWRGEELDKESGYSHLAHAICCLLFMLTHTLHNRIDIDDRLVEVSSPPHVHGGGDTDRDSVCTV